MKRAIILALASVFLINCSGSTQPIPTYTPFPTYTPLPTYTPFPTNTPLSRIPPKRTPTPNALSDCDTLMQWTNGNKTSLNQLASTYNELVDYMASAPSNQYSLKSIANTLREYSTRFQNLATNLSKQDVPPKYQRQIKNLLDTLTAFSVSLRDSAQAIEQGNSRTIASAGQKVTDGFHDIINALNPLSSAYDQCTK